MLIKIIKYLNFILHRNDKNDKLLAEMLQLEHEKNILKHDLKTAQNQMEFISNTYDTLYADYEALKDKLKYSMNELSNYHKIKSIIGSVELDQLIELSNVTGN